VFHWDISIYAYHKPRFGHPLHYSPLPSSFSKWLWCVSMFHTHRCVEKCINHIHPPLPFLFTCRTFWELAKLFPMVFLPFCILTAIFARVFWFVGFEVVFCLLACCCQCFGFGVFCLWDFIYFSFFYFIVFYIYLNVHTLNFSVFETGSHYVVQAGLELLILLPQSSEAWN
jgi:hypothetical protein